MHADVENFLHSKIVHPWGGIFGLHSMQLKPVDCCSADAHGKESSTAVDDRQRAGGGRADEAVGRGGWHGGGEDQGASDADTVEDSLVGDSDDNRSGRVRPSRGHRHGGGHQRPARGHRPRHAAAAAAAANTSSYRVFIALFDYSPATMSPNPDAVDEELGFYEGQLLKVSIYERARHVQLLYTPNH